MEYHPFAVGFEKDGDVFWLSFNRNLTHPRKIRAAVFAFVLMGAPNFRHGLFVDVLHCTDDEDFLHEKFSTKAKWTPSGPLTFFSNPPIGP